MNDTVLQTERRVDASANETEGTKALILRDSLKSTYICHITWI